MGAFPLDPMDTITIDTDTIDTDTIDTDTIDTDTIDTDTIDTDTIDTDTMPTLMLSGSSQPIFLHGLSQAACCSTCVCVYTSYAKYTHKLAPGGPTD